MAIAFTAEMTVAAALSLHPRARWVLTAWHLGRCAGCETARLETLAQVAEAYGLPVERIVEDLNAWCAQNE
ncbi:MAG TPA: disulfide oxidoreductase [Thermoanaerobaculia bacterium]|nr:disulfide oxidoreductase [Thermoanaerobaculia bacterium]